MGNQRPFQTYPRQKFVRGSLVKYGHPKMSIPSFTADSHLQVNQPQTLVVLSFSCRTVKKSGFLLVSLYCHAKHPRLVSEKGGQPPPGEVALDLVPSVASRFHRIGALALKGSASETRRRLEQIGQRLVLCAGARRLDVNWDWREAY